MCTAYTQTFADAYSRVILTFIIYLCENVYKREKLFENMCFTEFSKIVILFRRVNRVIIIYFFAQKR